MVSYSIAALGAATVIALTTPGVVVEAHQRVYFPEVIYTVADRGTNWGPQAFLEKQGYKTTKDFSAYLKANNYKTLRAFMDKEGAYKPNKGATVECGFTDPNAPAQPIPTNGNFRTSGYTHEGPCEIWIDDVMIKHGDNCHFDIANKVFTDTIDYSACKGECMLKWYWLGVRPMGKKYSWQVYKACIPLADKSGNGAKNKDNSSTTKPKTKTPPMVTPAPTKKTPAPAKTTTTKAPAASDDGETTGNDDDDDDTKTTSAPDPTTTPTAKPTTKPTAKPTAATKKPAAGCKRSRDD